MYAFTAAVPEGRDRRADRTGEPAPTGPTRRGAKPPVLPVAAIDDPALPEVLAELAAMEADEMDADTVNRAVPSRAR